MNTDGFSKPAANGTWKPGKPGDAIRGIITGVIKEFSGKYGPGERLEVVGLEGGWSGIDENNALTGEEFKVVKGETYSIIARNTFEEDFKKGKIGQEFVIRFVEMRKPMSGGKPYKYVECLLGGMNEEYVAAHTATASAEERAF